MTTANEVRRDWGRPGYDTEVSPAEVELRLALKSANDRIRECARAEAAASTNAARAVLLWVLWHHQGGSSPVGQRIRQALGISRFEPLSDEQTAVAKQWDERIAAGLADKEGPAAMAAESARAFAIADQAMFEVLESECVAQDEFRTVLGLTDGGQHEVACLAQASGAIQEAFDWLRPRGYVELGHDGHGQFISIIRRPGED